MSKSNKVIDLQDLSQARQEAFHEAEEREMRRVINFHSGWSNTEKEVSERNERLQKKEMDRRESRRDAESRKQANLHTFLRRNFWCVAIFAVVCILDVFCLLDFIWCLAIVSALGVFLSVNFFQYVTRNYKLPAKERKMECA